MIIYKIVRIILIAFFLSEQIGSFATVALELLKSPLSALQIALREKWGDESSSSGNDGEEEEEKEEGEDDDDAIFLQKKLKMHWQVKAADGVFSFENENDKAFFEGICSIVTGALDPHPTHRWTPAKVLEELDNIGK